MGKDKDKKPKKEHRNIGWVPFHQIQMTSLTHMDNLINEKYTQYYADRTIIDNNTEGTVATVKHIKCDITIQTVDVFNKALKFLGNVFGEIVSAVTQSDVIGSFLKNDVPINQLFNSNLLTFRIYLLYLPREYKNETHKYISYMPSKDSNSLVPRFQLLDNCLIRQHPEYILDMKNIVFGVRAPATITLASTLARNLKCGDSIAIAASVVVDPIISFKAYAPYIPITIATSFAMKK